MLTTMVIWGGGAEKVPYCIATPTSLNNLWNLDPPLGQGYTNEDHVKCSQGSMQLNGSSVINN